MFSETLGEKFDNLPSLASSKITITHVFLCLLFSLFSPFLFSQGNQTREGALEMAQKALEM